MSLTRSPLATYIWMAISLVFVVFLFARWDLLTAAGRQWQWWLVLVVFLAADFLFLLVPIRARNSLRYLSAAGKRWAGATWLLVLLFLLTIVPQSANAFRKQHPLLVTAAALLLLVVLLVAIAKLTRSWVNQSLRTIVARFGGGFLVAFPQSPENGEQAESRGAPLAAASESAQILLALRAIPGAEEDSAGRWRVPAQAAAAAALLEIARRFDFDFVPHPRAGQGR